VDYVHNNEECKKYLQVAPYVKCSGMPHLEKFFQDIADVGGEGIILRDPLSTVIAGRSAGYLKHKVPLPPLTTNG